MNNKTEQRIITQILAGKSDEFAYFLDTYGQQVFALIARMTDSDEDAEELTQDTFMKAYEHLHQFNGGSSFSTWLYLPTTPPSRPCASGRWKLPW